MKGLPVVLLILVLPAVVLLSSCGQRDIALILADEALDRLLDYQGIHDRNLQRMAGELGFRLEILRPGEDGQFSLDAIKPEALDLALVGGPAFPADQIPGDVPLVVLNAAAAGSVSGETGRDILSLKIMPDLLDEDFIRWLEQPADALVYLQEEIADHFRDRADWNKLVRVLEAYEQQWLDGDEDLSLQRNRIEARLADENKRVVLLVDPESAQELRPRNPARQDRLYMPYLSDRNGMDDFFPLDYSWMIMEILSSARDEDGPILHILLPFHKNAR